MVFAPFGGGFDAMFTIVPVIIGIGFVLVFGNIIFTMIKGGMEWSKNNNSPLLTVNAKIVAKRTAVSSGHHHHGNNTSMYHHSLSTAYFATFEVESSDMGRMVEQQAQHATIRVELRVPDNEFGLLVENDLGKLTFQGTRYKGFERNRSEG